MARALLLIDIQRHYFPGGAYPLVGCDAAPEAAAGEQVHAASLAALADGYADVVEARAVGGAA